MGACRKLTRTKRGTHLAPSHHLARKRDKRTLATQPRSTHSFPRTSEHE